MQAARGRTTPIAASAMGELHRGGGTLLSLEVAVRASVSMRRRYLEEVVGGLVAVGQHLERQLFLLNFVLHLLDVLLRGLAACPQHLVDHLPESRVVSSWARDGEAKLVSCDAQEEDGPV